MNVLCYLSNQVVGTTLIEDLRKKLNMANNNKLPVITYDEYINEKTGGFSYPPLPSHLQNLIDTCIKNFGKNSDEFVVLSEDIAFIDGEWIRMFINW
jgi:hypothetical protein